MSEAASRHDRLVVVSETGVGPFGAAISIGDHRLTADEPVTAGGLNAGPDPYEFLLAGLGACTAMTLRLYADRKGWPLSHVEVSVRHAARAANGASKDVFERDIWLEGQLSDEERAHLLAIADRCPVSRTLVAGVAVQTRQGEPTPADAASARSERAPI